MTWTSVAMLLGVAAAAATARVPTGATIGPDGSATILSAPPDRAAVAAASVRTPSQRHWYAEQYGLTEAEAKARLAAQAKLQPKFQALNARLRKEQKGNFIGAMLRHEPDWAYVFVFKRNPSRTLARYTREPRFEAERGKYSQQDRARIVAPWQKRWQSEGIPFGFGLDAVYPTMEVQLGITAAEWRDLSKARGWGEPPPPIVLKYAKPPMLPAVDPQAASLLKGFASERRATLMQLMALGTGTLKLKDGCLVVEQRGSPDRIALFHRETGIGFDREGYMALIDRMTGKVRARVGEKLAWGAPNGIPEKGMEGLEQLKRACPGELTNIGNPESAAVFEARHPR